MNLQVTVICPLIPTNVAIPLASILTGISTIILGISVKLGFNYRSAKFAQIAKVDYTELKKFKKSALALNKYELFVLHKIQIYSFIFSDLQHANGRAFLISNFDFGKGENSKSSQSDHFFQ